MTRYIDTEIIAGDTLKVEDIIDTTYPSTSGWTLYFKLGSNDAVAAVGADDGSYDLTVAASVTSSYSTGYKNYALYVSKGSPQEIYSVETGVVEIKARTSTTLSHAQTVLAAIEAVIEKRATKVQESMSLGGSTLSRTPLDQLIEFRKYYKEIVIRELNKNKTKYKMFVRM